ncbi:hypothetical protein Tco_0514227 [Tanacetum coccineum]
MSDSEDSTVTYTVVSSPFGGLSDISPGVNGPPMMLEDPYAYVVAVFQAPPSPDYVSGPEYPPSLEFDPKPDLEEDPTDYPVDGGDDDDDNESSDDDEDDDDDVKEGEDDEEDEEEHLAPADSTAVDFPAVKHAPSAEETEPFETDESAATPPPHPAYWVTARISIRDEPPTPFWSDTEVARLLAIPTPPPSPLSPWSSPLPQIPSLPLPLILSPLPVSSPFPVSPPLPFATPPLPVSPIYLLGYRAAMIRLRAKAPSTSHLPPPHIIISHTRVDTPPPSANQWERTYPRICLPTSEEVMYCHFRVLDYGFVAIMDREIRRDQERDVGYGITDTWDEMLVDMLGAPATDETEDRRAHARTTLLMEREARMSREAWGRSMDASDLARSEVMSLRTTVLGQQAVITELQAADRRRQAAITELLAADRRRQAQFIEALKLLKRLQTQMTEFERQQGPAKGPAQPDAPEEAGSSS